MTVPRLTIITVNLNNKNGLQKTIQSVIKQTYENYEYILIDGASEDGSVDVIRQYNSKIKLWISEPDEGIYNAMNKGIKKANGDYCLFLNSGDYLIDSTILDKIFNKGVQNDIIYGDLLIVDKSNDWIKTYPDKLSFDYFLKDTLPHPATFIKRKILDELGYFNEDNFIVSDWEFFTLAICKYNCTYNHVDFVISGFGTDGICSLAENQDLINKEKDKVLSSDFSLFLDNYSELNTLRFELKNLRNSRLFKVRSIILKFFRI